VADEQNAMTAAEAQSFKRPAAVLALAVICTLPETWCRSTAKQADQLPALPTGRFQGNPATGKTTRLRSRPPVVQRGPSTRRRRRELRSSGASWGPDLREILWRVARARQANAVLMRNFKRPCGGDECASRGIRKTALSPSRSAYAVCLRLDRLHIAS